MQSHDQKVQHELTKIEGKLKQIEQTIDKLQAEAKEYLSKAQGVKGAQKDMYKNKALMALNKKKQYEKQMRGYMNQQMTMEQLKMNTEAIKGQREMMGVMEQAVQEQKKHMQKVDLDKMADLQDEMLDMKFESEYMNEMMNRNYEVDIDEDELDDELMEFERELAQEKKRAMNTGQKQTVPAGKNNQQTSYKNQDIEAMLRDM